jgi:hypothetical protein
MFEWIQGEPPRDGRRYLLRFKSGIVCSGMWRKGDIGDPQNNQIAWRCDCCGRFADPVSYMQVGP